MTIDELRARKQELLARKKYEMELQEQGKGDNFALFMVNEELLNVNAQLRAIRPAGNRQQIGPRGRRITADFSARFNAGDHQQFIDWTREDSDQEADEARAKVLDMLHTGIFSISNRQREILLLWCKGLNRTAIAEKLGVDKSTICRTLKRAQYNLRQLTEARMTVDRLRHDNRLDVSDPEVGKLLISALTPHQSVCFYLYYSEQLSMREVGQLLQVDNSTICRTVQRAVARISDVLGDSIGILENVEELDELVYLIYCNLRDRYDDLPPSVQKHIKLMPAAEYINPDSIPRKVSDDNHSIRRPKIRILTGRKARRGEVSPEQHGRLFQALMERYQSVKAKGQWKNPIARWLITIFQVISRPKKPL